MKFVRLFVIFLTIHFRFTHFNLITLQLRLNVSVRPVPNKSTQQRFSAKSKCSVSGWGSNQPMSIVRVFTFWLGLTFSHPSSSKNQSSHNSQLLVIRLHTYLVRKIFSQQVEFARALCGTYIPFPDVDHFLVNMLVVLNLVHTHTQTLTFLVFLVLFLIKLLYLWNARNCLGCLGFEQFRP